MLAKGASLLSKGYGYKIFPGSHTFVLSPPLHPCPLYGLVAYIQTHVNRFQLFSSLCLSHLYFTFSKRKTKETHTSFVEHNVVINFKKRFLKNFLIFSSPSPTIQLKLPTCLLRNAVSNISTLTECLEKSYPIVRYEVHQILTNGYQCVHEYMFVYLFLCKHLH